MQQKETQKAGSSVSRRSLAYPPDRIGHSGRRKIPRAGFAVAQDDKLETDDPPLRKMKRSKPRLLNLIPLHLNHRDPLPPAFF